MKLKKLLESKRYLIMGILNFTPDSFSDGGDFFNIESAVSQVKNMIEEGVDIIDIGAESTRPGATIVSSEEEKLRLGVILPILRTEFPDVCFSIDTYKADVAEFAIKNGIDVLNDVYCAKNNGMADVAAKYNVPIIIMHNGGVEEGREVDNLLEELQESIDICEAAGVKKENIIIDPGMGFGKKAVQNIIITNSLERLKSFNCEILYAVSRKRTTDFILGGGSYPKDRDVVSATLSLEAIKKGARLVRVHNVKIMKEMLMTYEAMERYS